MQKYGLNHHGNACVIADLYSKQLKYDTTLEEWIVWLPEKKRWALDTTNCVLNLAVQAVNSRLSENREIDKTEYSWIRKSKDYNNLTASLSVAKALPELVWNKPWDRNAWLFQVQNGIINLETRQLREATPEDSMVKIAQVSFDCTAQCPTWTKFISEIFSDDKELIAYVQKAVGYTMTGSVREQCLFACHGSGANGKSTFLGVISHILGNYACNLRATVLESYGRNLAGEGVELPGSRMAKCEEVGESEALDSGRIKAWTGENEMVVRPLYKSAITFPPTHKLWLTFNNLPEITDQSEAIERRLKLIPFKRRFSGNEIDKNLMQKLIAESSGILNWILDGCSLWLAEGLNEPQAVIEEVRTIRATSDHIKAFADECLMAAPEDMVTSNELYQAYQRWCGRNDIKPENQRRLISRVQHLFNPFTNVRMHGGNARGWRGVKLVSAVTSL